MKTDISKFRLDRTCQECIHKRVCGHFVFFLRIFTEENNRIPIIESTAIEPIVSQMAIACVEYRDKSKVLIEQ